MVTSKDGDEKHLNLQPSIILTNPNENVILFLFRNKIQLLNYSSILKGHYNIVKNMGGIGTKVGICPTYP